MRWEETIHLKQGEKALVAEGSISPDGEFIACPVAPAGPGKPEIRIFDAAGKSHGVLIGRAPHWKGGDVWNPGRR